MSLFYYFAFESKRKGKNQNKNDYLFMKSEKPEKDLDLAHLTMIHLAEIRL